LGKFLKRQNLQLIGIEGAKLQAKGIENMFNKIIAQNLRKR
jgi:hypothetical protein